MTIIKFVCSKCGLQSWFDVNLDTYVISEMDLLCDDCNPLTNDEKALVQIGK